MIDLYDHFPNIQLNDPLNIKSPKTYNNIMT